MLGVRGVLMPGAPACRAQRGGEESIRDPRQGHPVPPPQPRGHHPVGRAGAPNIPGGTHPSLAAPAAPGGCWGQRAEFLGCSPEPPPAVPAVLLPHGAAAGRRARSTLPGGPGAPAQHRGARPRSSSFSALCSPRRPPRSSSLSSPAAKGKPAAMRGPAPRARRGEAGGAPPPPRSPFSPSPFPRPCAGRGAQGVPPKMQPPVGPAPATLGIGCPREPGHPEMGSGGLETGCGGSGRARGLLGLMEGLRSYHRH